MDKHQLPPIVDHDTVVPTCGALALFPVPHGNVAALVLQRFDVFE
jgi:hypothetical protein